MSTRASRIDRTPRYAARALIVAACCLRPPSSERQPKRVRPHFQARRGDEAAWQHGLDALGSIEYRNPAGTEGLRSALDTGTLDELRNSVGGDQEFLAELIDDLLADAPAQLESLREAAGSG